MYHLGASTSKHKLHTNRKLARLARFDKIANELWVCIHYLGIEHPATRTLFTRLSQICKSYHPEKGANDV